MAEPTLSRTSSDDSFGDKIQSPWEPVSLYSFGQCKSIDETERSACLLDKLSTEGGSAQTPLTSNIPTSDLPLVKHSRHGLVLVTTMAAAGVPALFGVLFWVSLGFYAKDGIYKDRRFIRPTSQGLDLVIGTNLMNPLLISSVSSTVVSTISPLVLMLVAYFLGDMWLRASGIPPPDSNFAGPLAKPAKLPTPFQHAMILRICAVASEWTLIQALKYCLTRSPSPSSKLRHRSHLTPIFYTGVFALFWVCAFSWSIKLVDILLHDQIQGTVLRTRNALQDYTAGFALRPECLASNETASCPQSFRAASGYQAANNLSDVFKVYSINEYQDLAPNLAIAGPTVLNASVDVVADTIGVSTQCAVFRPICSVEDLQVKQCWNPLAQVQADFFAPDVSTLETRLQIALAYTNEKGRDRTTTESDANTYASNMNPTGIVGWSCFPDYANIIYNDTDTDFTFVNWWMIGSGVPNTPRPLCSIFSCNSTTYNLRYVQRNGSISIDPAHLVLSDGATTMATTGGLPYTDSGGTQHVGTDSGIYQYSAKYFDSQLQVIINDAGNRVGNNTKNFANNLAQGVSTLMVSWGGAETLQVSQKSYSAVEEDLVLAISVPLAASYTYIGLHLLYATLILALGAATFWLPSNYRRTDKIVFSKRKGLLQQVAVDEVSAASLRFNDIAVVMHEMLPPTLTDTGSFHDRQASVTSFDSGSAFRRRKVQAESDYRSYFTTDGRPNGELHLKFENR